MSCREDRLDLPSDLDGITRAQFNRRDDVRAAVGPAASNIRRAIKSARPRPERMSNASTEGVRGRVRSLAHEVLTELETNRYQLAEANARECGWGADDMLQAAKFDKWEKDPDASAHTGVMDALRGTYIWLHRKNIEMQRRDQAAWNSVGGVGEEPGLALSETDLAELEEGISRILAAQDRVRALIIELGDDGPDSSSGDAIQTVPATGVKDSVADSELGRQSFALVIQPRLATRTIFDVTDGRPTGEMFLEVHNASQFAAADAEVEVRYRDGRVEQHSRASIDPDHLGNPRWNVPLTGVAPATGDVFAEVRQRIESVALSYGDVNKIARYRVQILAPASVGQPFEIGLADVQRIEL